MSEGTGPTGGSTGTPGTLHPLSPERQRAVLIILAAAALMVMYVETMIIPGLTRFQAFFGDAPLSSVTWILSAYLLVGVAFTPIAGKLGDIYGKKRVLVGILAVYFVAVTVAGFTPNIGDAFGMGRPNELYLLIAVRAVQGVGMAMFPLAFALIGEEFPREKVAGAQGIVSAMFAAGASVGLFGGAWVTQTYGWQLTYHTVIPIALLVLVLAVVLLEESRVRLTGPVDVPGASFLALALLFFLLGLTLGPNWGWSRWSAYTLVGLPLGAPTFFVLALVFLVAFVVRERTTDRPIVDFAKLGERNILLANAAGFFAGIAMFMMFVGVVARAEAGSPVGLGKSPLDFGYYSLPTTLVNMVVAPFIGRSIQRFGPKLALLLGSGLMVLGGLFLAVSNQQVIDLIVGPIPIMSGAIAVFIAMTNLVVVSSRPAETGIQTGMNQTFRNLGTSIGPVVASTILASVLTTYTQATPYGAVSFSAPSAQAFQLIFLVIAILGVLSFALCAMVRNFRFDARGTRREVGVLGHAPIASVAVPGATPEL